MDEPPLFDRKSWMSLLAKADDQALETLWSETDLAPEYEWLRGPQSGTVMVRGRAGSTGAPFNLGEMTVTRCALRLGSGTVGHGYVAGRSARKAEIAALCDALLQQEEAATVTARILRPLAERAATAAEARAAKAAATKVDFFTLVRGDT